MGTCYCHTAGAWEARRDISHVMSPFTLREEDDKHYYGSASLEKKFHNIEEKCIFFVDLKILDS